jgi:hypothetical protein
LLAIASSLTDHGQPAEVPLGGTLPSDRALDLERATWAFVVLGVVLRMIRYAMDYPLWWDEAFVAVNFIRRDYVDLLRPLDYGQVCPILFLWAELTIVKLLGFSEWSLRLFPQFCAVVSVVLFRYAARCVVRGVPLLLAVAIFAVSYHPIRHAADVKPYASDLLAALTLLGLALAWLHGLKRDRWLWALAAIAPLAIALSHPAAFIAGGIVIGLLPSVAAVCRRGASIAFASYTLSTIGAFLGLYAVFTRGQAAATLTAMQAEWHAAFPPWNDVLRLPGWLISVHTGSMFAYPCGGDRGASTLTLILFLLGAIVLWRRGQRAMLRISLAPFLIALLAAAIKRYPYGAAGNGPAARVMQYLVPSICLLTGTGITAVIDRFRDPRIRRRILRLCLLSFAAVGSIPLAAEGYHPYRTMHAQKARMFAREFWPEVARDAEPVCMRWDYGVPEWDSTNLNVAVYLCNQMICSPARRHGYQTNGISGNRPLRCVLPLADPAQPRVASWLASMKARYRLKDCRTHLVDVAECTTQPRTERYVVYDFVPRESQQPGTPIEPSVAASTIRGAESLGPRRK